MDRNKDKSIYSAIFGVALRKESVDRNSLRCYMTIRDFYVALRKESVDRNRHLTVGNPHMPVALRKESVDRNCGCLLCAALYAIVALRKESVDRNFVPFDVIRPAIGRSPQGERG